MSICLLCLNVIYINVCNNDITPTICSAVTIKCNCYLSAGFFVYFDWMSLEQVGLASHKRKNNFYI